jgi:capsule polysaccharide export protein KpsE/RkpR
MGLPPKDYFPFVLFPVLVVFALPFFFAFISQVSFSSRLPKSRASSSIASSGAGIMTLPSGSMRISSSPGFRLYGFISILPD